MKMKNIQKTLIFILLISILSLNVSAWAVTSFYKSPVTMYPGQNANVEYWLQNMADDHDMYITANIVKGSEIFSITDSKNDYFVKQGVKDVKVHGQIDIPSLAEIGEKYYVEIAFSEIPGPGAASSEGPVALRSRVNKAFEIIIKKQPTKTNKFLSLVTPILTIVGILAIVIVILYCFIKKEMAIVNKKKLKRKK